MEVFSGDRATSWVVLAGLSQLGLAVGSALIPAVLGWREETRRLSDLTRSVFWTYAGYILGTNLCMGLLSVMRPEWLLDGSGLARSVCAYITLYWGVRLSIQLVSFRKHAPAGRLFLWAEGGLSLLFLGWTVLYGAIALGGL